MGAIVYGLYDPRDNALRYVGVTTKPLERRFYFHEHSCSNVGVGRLYDELAAVGLRMEIRAIEHVGSADVAVIRARERFHIQAAVLRGDPVTNKLGRPRGFSITNRERQINPFDPIEEFA